MCVVIMKAGVTKPHMKYMSSGYTPECHEFLLLDYVYGLTEKSQAFISSECNKK